MIRASGKARRRSEATQQKATGRPDVHEHDCHEGKIAGFSSSFKKRYYGGEYCNKYVMVFFP